MITVKCQHSGLEFEAETRRTKQHPLVAAAKKAADKNGTYRQLNDALDNVRKAGGYETIEQYMALVEDAMKGARKWTPAMQASEDRASAEAAAQKRAATNAKLRAAGYTWSKVMTDWDNSDDFVWVLNAPDGREVSVTTALHEIEIGAEAAAQERAEKAAAQAAAQQAKAAAKSVAEKMNEEEINAIKAIETIAKGYTRIDSAKVNTRDFTRVVTVQYRADAPFRAHSYAAIGYVDGVPHIKIAWLSLDDEHTAIYAGGGEPLPVSENDSEWGRWF